MGCGSSSRVGINDPTNKKNQLKISNFEENDNEENKSGKKKKKTDFFDKIKKMELPENPEV